MKRFLGFVKKEFLSLLVFKVPLSVPIFIFTLTNVSLTKSNSSLANDIDFLPYTLMKLIKPSLNALILFLWLILLH